MNKIDIETIIKSKLENHEFKYDNSWNKFEKNIIRNKVSFKKYYYYTAAAIIIIATSLFLITNNSYTKKNIAKSIKETISNKLLKNTNEITQKTENTSTANKESKSKETSKTIQNTINKTELTYKENDNEQTNAQTNTNQPNNAKPTTIVNNEKTKISANFIANVVEGCEPFTVFFTPETTQNLEYTWIFSDGTTSHEKNPKHTFKKAGNYTVELIVKNNNSTQNLIKENYITVNTTPIATFYSTNEDNIYYFSCSTDYKNINWQINSTKISTDENFNYEFKTIGKSEITLFVENEFGCKANSSKIINIEPVFQIANAFTPDNNGNNETFAPIFENIDNYKFTLYIYDAFGKQIFKSNFDNEDWNGKINNSNNIATEGSYVWKLLIKDNSGNQLIKKGSVFLKK